MASQSSDISGPLVPSWYAPALATLSNEPYKPTYQDRCTPALTAPARSRGSWLTTKLPGLRVQFSAPICVAVRLLIAALGAPVARDEFK